MAATKNARTLKASTSVSQGSTTPCTEWDLSGAYGGLAVVRLTNSGSPPTTAPVVKFYVGHATGVKRLFYQATGTTVAGDTDIPCKFPKEVIFANIDVVWGSVNGGTVEAYGQEFTAP